MPKESTDIRSRGVRLDGWKAIAEYADRSERAVQRWSTQRGFPVHRIGGTGSVFAWTDEIDEWFNRQGTDGMEETAKPGAVSPAIPLRSGTDDTAGDPGPSPVPAAPAPPPVVVPPFPWAQSLLVMVGAVVLGSVVSIGLLRLAGATGAVGVSGPASNEPCHLVDWPTSPLPFRGGRVRVAVRPTTTPCDWAPPRVDARWLLVVPPSEMSAPQRILLSPNHPLAMPPYDPSAQALTLELTANHTTQPRVAVLHHGTREYRLTQEAAPDACLMPPGPGFVADGWRYRLSRKAYPHDAPFLAAVRRDDAPDAAGVTWDMLYALLLGNEPRGEAFAELTGIGRAPWEENDASSECFHVWLSGQSPPEFLTYFLNRRRLSYEERSMINNDQYQLGAFPIPGQVLYRVPFSADAPSPAASEASRP